MRADKGRFSNQLSNGGPVGQGMNRVDARDKVTGDARFVDDLSPRGVLTATVIRSTVPSAKIMSTNFDQLPSIDGVEAIVTAKDIPGENLIPVIEDDQPALAKEEVRYDGEPIALVAAEGKRIAGKVQTAVEIEYDLREPVLDPLDALKSTSPVVAQPKFSEAGNLFDELTIDKGDVEKAFNSTPIIIEREYRTGYQEHAYMEPQGVIAIPASNGSIEIQGSMQCPYYVRNAVSTVLDMPLNKVNVVLTTTGGAFGGKEDVPSQLGAYAALLADASGEPVKLVYDRREDIKATSKRHPSIVKYETAADRHGKLVGVKVDIYLDSGAYQTLSPAVLWRSLVHATGPYTVPNVEIVARSVATNKVPNGAFRGFGSPQVIFPYESQIELLAEKLELDPMDVRKKNVVRRGDRTATDQKLEKSVGAVETLTRARQVANWSTVKSEYSSWNENHHKIKKGIGACAVMYGVGMGGSAPFLDKAGAYLKLESDGSLTVAVGNTEMGQGAETVLTQIAAQSLGIKIQNVNFTEVDTSRVPDSGPTVASRATTMSGNAIIDAANKLKPRIKQVGRNILDCKSVSIANGYVIDEDDTEHRVELQEVALQMWSKNVDMAVEGWTEKGVWNWNPKTSEGDAYFVFAYATHITKVEVDTFTGETNLIQHVAVHDSGKIINPVTAAGQIEGGAAQGIGFALTEDLKSDKGKFLDPDFTNYLVPTAEDVPDDLIVEFVEDEYPGGPYGAKGLGEVPLMAAHAAAVNAVSDAIGTRLYSYPATPEKVLFAYLGTD